MMLMTPGQSLYDNLTLDNPSNLCMTPSLHQKEDVLVGILWVGIVRVEIPRGHCDALGGIFWGQGNCPGELSGPFFRNWL